MTAFHVVLITVGVLLGMVVVCAAALWWNRNGETNAYDERQLAEQGKAREVSDTVGAVYFLLLICWLVLAEANGRETVKPYLLISIGLLIQIMTYHIYCVMTHAALPFGKKPKTAIFWHALAGLVQFGNYFTNHTGARFAAGEGYDIGLLNLIAGVALFALAFMHLLTLLWKEKE